MNKIKLYSHLGGIVAVLIGALVIIVPLLTRWYPWLLLGVIGATIAAFFYVLGYYYVRSKIDDI